MYLSLEGVPFPVCFFDRAVPTQMLRWPQKRFLVLCHHQPHPLPQRALHQKLLDSDQMLGMLRNFAIARSKQLDYAIGLYDASYMIGSH